MFWLSLTWKPAPGVFVTSGLTSGSRPTSSSDWSKIALRPGAAFRPALILGILASKACVAMLELVPSAAPGEPFARVTPRLLRPTPRDQAERVHSPPPPAPGRIPVQSELPENWTDTRETLLEGMLFSLKYMGMTLVEQPKGEELSAAAVKRIVATAKASGKKLQKVTLKVSPRGIVLNDSGTNELIENISIYRISYCTADKIHDKVFAYIAQNQLNENLECHAFLCTKRKMAQAVTLTVAQAFKIAFEFWQAAKEEREKRERSILEGEGTSSPSSEAPAHPDASATGNLLDLEDPDKSPLTSSANSPHLDNSMFGPSSSVNNNVVWEMDDGLDEAFSRLAQSRTNPHVLDTGLTAQDIQSAETLSPVDWNKIDSNTGEKDDLFMF